MLFVRGDAASKQSFEELLPVVRYALKRKINQQEDYWAVATEFELALLTGEWAAAQTSLGRMWPLGGSFEFETTLHNMELIEHRYQAMNENLEEFEKLRSAMESRLRQLEQGSDREIPLVLRICRHKGYFSLASRYVQGPVAMIQKPI